MRERLTPAPPDHRARAHRFSARPQAQNTPIDAPEKPTEKEMGSMKWDKPGRDLALCTQVAFAGQKAFLTAQANVKADKYGKGGITYNREHVCVC